MDQQDGVLRRLKQRQSSFPVENLGQLAHLGIRHLAQPAARAPSEATV